MKSDVNDVSSGVHLITNMTKKFAVTFDNDTCPLCGNRMMIRSAVQRDGSKTEIRYECEGCRMVSPITRDILTGAILPGYGESFGKMYNILGKDKLEEVMKYYHHKR